MEGSSKSEEEKGFAALFNEFVSKVQTPSKTSQEMEKKNSDSDDNKKESGVKNEDKKDSVESESSRSGKHTVGSVSEDNKDKKMDCIMQEQIESSNRDKNLQTSSKSSPAGGSEETTIAASSEENKSPNRNFEKSKQLVQNTSSQNSSPQSAHQESSPAPSNSDSSYQTSPASSTFSSTVITPSSSPLTTLQSRSSILSAASTKLSSSSARKLPPKVEKPVLRDRAGRKRYNSLEGEFVVNIDVKRERSKPGMVGQSNRRRLSKVDKEGPRYRNQRGKPAAKQEERKRPHEKVLRPGLEFEVGFKLEAMDFCQNKWYPAKIVQVDEEDQQVLIHFEKWNSRYDEWIDCESERLRPLVRQSTRKEALPQQHPTGEYKYGEEVLARWSDCRYYPAKVLNINKNGTYRMLFYDGIEKNVLATNIRMMPDELKAQNFFSNFTLPPAPPVKGKKRWFAKEESTPAATDQPETTTEPTAPTTTTKRRLSGTSPPLSPPSVPPKKIKVDEKVKSPKEVKTPKTKASASPVSEVPPPETQATPEVGAPIVVDPKPVLKPVLSSAKMEELISRNIKEPLLNDKDLGLLRDRRQKILAPKELVIDLDHNKYKCDVKGCDKSFRKSTLLEYHKKYYHATKTSTSSAASRVLHRTRKMMTGSGTSGFNKTRSDARSKATSKRIRQKRLSAPADLVSRYSTRRADRGVVKKGVRSPGSVPEEQSSPLTERRSSRIRHHSAPLETQDDNMTVNSSPSEDTITDSKLVDHTESGNTVKVPINSSKIPTEVGPETDLKDTEIKSPPVQRVYDTSHEYAKRTDETTSDLKHALKTSREPVRESVREDVPIVRGMKSILKDVSMLQEEIRKEEERHRHRRKHKKNKDRKRRKKKKKDKEKRRRSKEKEKIGLDGSDEDTETDEEDEQRREGKRLPLKDGAPSSELFKEPNEVSGVRHHPTATFKSSVGVDDDVVKCVCKNTREEGFMIQCEVCNCWQHSTCVGLSNKSVPQTYACFHCHVSKGGLPPLYDSEAYEWFESGSLPKFPDFGKERDHQQDKSAKLLRFTTNNLISDLLMLAEVLEGLQQKIAILQNPDHPEAKLWAKDWILRSRRKTPPDLAESGMSDDLASTLKEMFSVGKLSKQGEGIQIGEGYEGGDLADTGEKDKGVVDHSDGLKSDCKKDSCVAMGQMMQADGTAEDISSGGNNLSDGIKGVDVTEAAIHGESSSPGGAAGAGTSGAGGQSGHSTILDDKVVSTSSKDTGTGWGSIPPTTAPVMQCEPLSEGAVQELSGVASEAGSIVGTTSDVVTGVATGIQTKQVKDGESRLSVEALSEEKNDGTQEMDEKSESRDTTELAGNTHKSVDASAEGSKQNTGMSIASNSIVVASRGQESQVSSVFTSSSVVKKDSFAVKEGNTVSYSKQDMSIESNVDKSVSNKEVSRTDHSPVVDADSSKPTVVEIPHGQNTNLSIPGQSSQPVAHQDASNSNRTESQTSGQNIISASRDSDSVTRDERIVKSNDRDEVVTTSDGSGDSVGRGIREGESPDVKPSEGKEMIVNVEDVIRRQMTKDNPGPSRGTEREGRGEETAPPTQETERAGDEAMDVDSTSSQGKDGESSLVTVTKSTAENIIAEEGLEDASVELSQAYLLRHINTLHDQLSERMSLIEMEVEKLEKMFSNSASEWQAITRDPTVMKKKLRVLLGDLHKINSIVSL